MNTAPAGRDASLDSARGLAVLAILWMHTVYWSGLAVDIPASWRLLSLMFDVPVFFLISGILLAQRTDMRRSALGLVRIYAYYAVFISLCFWGKYLLQGGEAREWGQWLLFHVPPQDGLLRAVAGSVWFMPVFIGAMVVAMLLQRIGQAAERIALLVIVSAVALVSRDAIGKPLEMGWTFFYFTFYVLLGMQLVRMRLALWHVVLTAALWVAAWYAYAQMGDIPLPDLNDHKLPHDRVFLLFSIPSLLLVMGMRGAGVHAKPFEWLGRNAMPLYLAQGISSSALYYLLPYTEAFSPVPRIAVHFAANTALAVALAWMMHSAHHRVSELIGPYDRHPAA